MNSRYSVAIQGLPRKTTFEMLKRVFSRGLFYSVGIACNRMIPERYFRFRIFRVFELEPTKDDQATNQDLKSESLSRVLKFRWCENEADFDEAQTLTHYRPADGDSVGRHDASRRRCCLVSNQAGAVGGVWLAEGHFDEHDLGITIDLAENQTWLFAAFVEKSHRRRGVYRRLINHVLAQQLGATFASINPTNKASIAAHRPYIRRTVGTCLAMRVRGRSFSWVTGDLERKDWRLKIAREPPQNSH